MHPAPEQARFRVLALHPHLRHVGSVVLDEDGLVPGAAFSLRTKRFRTLDRKLASLDQHFAASLERFKPTVVVVVRSKGCAWIDAMMARATTLADATELPVRIRYDTALTRLFVDDDVRGFDKLGRRITTAFFPELARARRRHTLGIGSVDLGVVRRSIEVGWVDGRRRSKLVATSPRSRIKAGRSTGGPA